MSQQSRYTYIATIDYLNEMKTINSSSLRKLAKTLDLSVNTIRSLLINTPNCRTSRKISIERINVR